MSDSKAVPAKGGIVAPELTPPFILSFTVKGEYKLPIPVYVAQAVRFMIDQSLKAYGFQNVEVQRQLTGTVNKEMPEDAQGR